MIDEDDGVSSRGNKRKRWVNITDPQVGEVRHTKKHTRKRWTGSRWKILCKNEDCTSGTGVGCDGYCRKHGAKKCEEPGCSMMQRPTKGGRPGYCMRHGAGLCDEPGCHNTRQRSRRYLF